jgi:hypothetical protein
MRKRVSGFTALVVGLTVLFAPPAYAAFGAIVELPAGKIYSPFGGPATVTFTFDGADSASVFTVRLRQVGEGTIKEKDFLIDPGTQASPRQVSFSWPSLTVSDPTEFEINVRPQAGGPELTSETFTLHPKLVSGLSATPSPFYPLIQDGYKDTTRIDYSLATDTASTIVRVFRADDYGRCCGRKIRQEELGPLTRGQAVGLER